MRARSATSSGVSSRMQRQCASGQRRGPCGRTGGRSSDSCPTDDASTAPAARTRSPAPSVRRSRPSACPSPMQDAAAPSRSSRARRSGRSAPPMPSSEARPSRRPRRAPLARISVASAASLVPAHDDDPCRPRDSSACRARRSTASASSPTRCRARARPVVRRGRRRAIASSVVTACRSASPGRERRARLLGTSARARSGRESSAAAPRDAGRRRYAHLRRVQRAARGRGEADALAECARRMPASALRSDPCARYAVVVRVPRAAARRGEATRRARASAPRLSYTITLRTAGCPASSGAAAGVVTTSTGPRLASCASSGVVRTVSPRKDVWMTSEDVTRLALPSRPAGPPETLPAGSPPMPTCFMRFFPSFCFSRSLRLRLMSPP